MEKSNPILSEAAGWLLTDKAVLMPETHLRALVNRLASGTWNVEREKSVPAVTQHVPRSTLAPLTTGTQTVIAAIPVQGVLNKQYDGWGMCSTTRLLEQLEGALADPAVSSIVLDIDSPGGFVNGSVEFADAVRGANAIKPVTAIVRGLCCSGAYWIASQCSKIISRPEAEVGNIGVYSVLMDVSGWYSQLGISLTTIASGQFKGLGADGKVTDDLIADTKRIVTGLFQQFVSAVAAGRDLDTNEALAVSDGRAFLGPQAKQLKLIDAIATGFAEAIDISTGAAAPEDSDMAQATKPGTAPTAAAPAQTAPPQAEKKEETAKHDHKVLDTTIESAKGHRAQVRAAMDYATDYEGEADDSMKQKCQATVNALKATSEEASRCAKALSAHVDADDDDEDKPKPDDTEDKKGSRGGAEAQGKAQTAAGFIAAFGDAGARWFVEGKSFEACAAEHIAALKTAHTAAVEKLTAAHKAEADALKAENAELKKKLAAIDRGNDPAHASAPEQPRSGATSGNGQGPAKKINGLSANLNRFASGLRFSDGPLKSLNQN